MAKPKRTKEQEDRLKAFSSGLLADKTKQEEARKKRKGVFAGRRIAKAFGEKPEYKKGDTEADKLKKDRDAATAGAIKKSGEAVVGLYKDRQRRKASKKAMAFKMEQAAQTRKDKLDTEKRKAKRERQSLRYRGRLALLKGLK